MRLSIAILVTLLPVGAVAAEWPEFRGPHRSGIAADGDFPVHFGPETNVLWKTPVPSGHSSPIVCGDQVYLTGFESSQLVTLAYDRHTGREIWRRTLEPGNIEPGSRLSHPATATPATDGMRIVAYFAPFGLVAFDLSGRELWRHRLPTPITGHGASSSPVLAGDRVLQLCDQDAGSYLLALDSRTGTVIWKAERPAFRRGFSTPLPWPPDHPEIAVVAGTLRLVAYDLADGRERWSVGGLPNEMVASPIAAGGSIFVAGWTPGSGVARMPGWEGLISASDTDRDGVLGRDEAPAGPVRQQFHYMDANRDGRLTQAEYQAIAFIFDQSKNVALAIRPGGAGDVTTTHVLWQQTRGLPYVSSPLCEDDRLWLVRNGGILSCLDAATGSFRFQEERIGAPGDFYASPVAAGGKLLVVSQSGIAVVLRAASALEVLARNSLGEEVLATPAIAGRTLHIRTQGALWAFRQAGID